MTAQGRAGAGQAIARSVFAVPGMHCASCIARIESGLMGIPGIVAARTNFTARNVTIDHLPELDVPALRAAIGSVGFDAEPLHDPGALADRRESRMLARATGVAGFASMNIMLLSVSVWSGAEGATRDLFHLLSGIIAIPTVAYSGRPFFRSAWPCPRPRSSRRGP